MAYSQEQKQYHTSRIRSIMVLQPDSSHEEIQRALDKSDAPIHLNRDYISNIKKKILRERAHRNDNLTVSARIAYIQDKKKLIDSQLWRLITDPHTSDRAKVAALGLLMKHEVDLLNSEMDAGVFERHIGKVATDRPVFDLEQRKLVLEALQAWGMIKPIPNNATLQIGPTQ